LLEEGAHARRLHDSVPVTGSVTQASTHTPKGCHEAKGEVT
jgi:hypothetical protein